MLLHLKQYNPEAFDCIVLDEAHHSSANTYQKVMNYFKPRLWLGMTATPDKRDDNIEGRNIYEIFNYQIAYEIRLQQAIDFIYDEIKKSPSTILDELKEKLQKNSQPQEQRRLST